MRCAYKEQFVEREKFNLKQRDFTWLGISTKRKEIFFMPHIVKRGESLGKIAGKHGITLVELIDANPQFRDDPDIVHPGDMVVIPDDDSPPQPQPFSAPSEFAARLASIVRARHDRFQFVNEADPVLCGQIRRWTIDIGGAFVSCTSNNHPWSAVFVSSCVKEAGATRAEFEFSKAHSVFVHKAIQDALNGRGVFHGLEITAHAPNVGDIIQHNRNNARFTFNHARRNSNYKSHSVIVVETGRDEEGRFALCIGGNEGDAIRRTKVRLTPQGFVRQRGRNPFICVIKTLK